MIWPMRLPRLHVLRPVGALLLLIVLVVVCRGSALVSPTALGPDEAELLAAGRRAAMDLAPYATYTTPTYLLLSPTVLGILARLGVPMVLQTAHLLSALAYIWIAFVGWYVMSLRLGWLASAVFVLPATVDLLLGPGPRQGDFLSLGTELLPVSIIMLGALVLFSSVGRPSERRLAVASALAGMAVWAKPQVALLAIGFCLAGLLIRRLPPRERDAAPGIPSARTDLLIVGASFAAPSVLFMLVILVQGTMPQFIEEPLAYSWSYITSRQQLGVVESAPPLVRLAGVILVAAGQPLAFLWALPGLPGLSAMWGHGAHRERAISNAIWLAPIIAAVVTLFAVIPLLPHYVNLWYAACILSGMAGLTAARVGRPYRDGPGWLAAWQAGSRSIVVLACVLVAGVAIIALPNMSAIGANVRAVAVAASSPAIDPIAGSNVAVDCPPRARVLVWGWAAELYAEYDWTPASRYVNSWPLARTLDPGPYKDTLFAEIMADPPACVVQAIGPQFFGGLDQSDSITAVMANLAAYLGDCYEASQEMLPGKRLVTLWRWSGTCGRG
jgi:hypothetical protein